MYLQTHGLLLFQQLRLSAGIAKKKNFFQLPQNTGDVYGLSECSFRRGSVWVATFYLFRWRPITKMIFQMQIQNYAGIGPHTEVCSSAKGARIAWLPSGFSLSQVREHGLRVTHFGGGTANSELNPWLHCNLKLSQSRLSNMWPVTQQEVTGVSLTKMHSWNATMQGRWERLEGQDCGLGHRDRLFDL